MTSEFAEAWAAWMDEHASKRQSVALKQAEAYQAGWDAAAELRSESSCPCHGDGMKAIRSYKAEIKRMRAALELIWQKASVGPPAPPPANPLYNRLAAIAIQATAALGTSRERDPEVPA